MNILDDEDDFPSGMPPITKGLKPPRENALTLLPRVMLEQVLGKAGMAKLRGSKSLCLVIETKSDDWVAPVERFLRQAGGFTKSVAKTAELARRRDDSTAPEVLRLLSQGDRVAGVASRFSYLPDSMVSAADIRVELPPITREIIETVIKRMCGRRVTVSAAVARLGFSELVSCLRAGDTAKANIERLERTAAASRTITAIGDVPHIRDLHGYGAAQVWALELIEDVEAWRRGEIEFDAIASRNVVIGSAPGMGKSSYARSLARSLNMPLVATSVGAWFANSPGHLDSVIKQIDQVFSAAASAAPAVLLLDEIDAVPDRARLDSRGADWWLPVITHLLTTLDSAVSGVADKLIVVGATNHADRLDAALVRPGRLDRIIHIGTPDAEALAGIMRQHLGPDLAGEDLSEVASLAIGATGAHVVGWVRAARRTARNARRPMLLSDLLNVIAPPDNRPVDLVDRIALHEAGHAVAAHVLKLASVLSVSIVAQGGAGGVTVLDFDGDLPTRVDVEKTVVQLLAGRAAEEVLLGEPGTGAGGTASSDLAIATRTLGLLHLGAGLGEDLTFRADAESVPAVLSMSRRHGDAVEADLRRLYARSLELIRENAPRVRAVADALIERRHLGPAGFLEVVDRTTRNRKKENRHG